MVAWWWAPILFLWGGHGPPCPPPWIRHCSLLHSHFERNTKYIKRIKIDPFHKAESKWRIWIRMTSLNGEFSENIICCNDWIEKCPCLTKDAIFDHDVKKYRNLVFIGDMHETYVVWRHNYNSCNATEFNKKIDNFNTIFVIIYKIKWFWCHDSKLHKALNITRWLNSKVANKPKTAFQIIAFLWKNGITWK